MHGMKSKITLIEFTLHPSLEQEKESCLFFPLFKTNYRNEMNSSINKFIQIKWNLSQPVHHVCVWEKVAINKTEREREKENVHIQTVAKTTQRRQRQKHQQQ